GFSGGGFKAVPQGPVTIVNGNGWAITNFVMGIEAFVGQLDQDGHTLPANLNNIPITFDAPPQGAGNVAAQGVGSTNDQGLLVINVTNAGRGYQSAPATVKAIIGGRELTVSARRVFASTATSLKIVSADLVAPAGGGGAGGTVAPTAQIQGPGSVGAAQ